MKTCTKCGKLKRLAEYNRHNGHSDGRQSHCKACHSAIAKKWRLRNKEQVRQRQRMYFEANRGYYMAYVDARRRGCPITPELARVIDQIRQQPCTYCGGEGGTVDHVVPLARGGTHDAWNLVAACVTCNSSKGVQLLEEWKDRPCRKAA